MQKDITFDSWSINLLRRLEELLDPMSSPGFELLPRSGREPRCSHKAPSGYPISYELWITLEGLADAFRGLNPQLDQAFIEADQEAILSRFPTVSSLAEGTFGNVFEFLRAAVWIPVERKSLMEEEFSQFIRQSRFDEVYESNRILAALQRMKDLCQPTKEDLMRVLRFKSIFEELTPAEFRHMQGQETVESEPAVEAFDLSCPVYHPAVWEWNEAVYATRFYINPYRGEKPGEPIPHPKYLNIGDRGYPTPREFFAEADLDEIRQYMAVCLRGEKWCNGHISGEFERGVICAAFHRLSELDNALSG